MKKLLRNSILCMLALATLTQCKKSINSSSELELVEIAKTVTVEAARAEATGLTKPTKVLKTGKIYIYKNFLFINEVRKGIHIFENSDPSKPVNVAFLKVPGNVDMAVSNDILYADSYVDLLAFDISSISSIKEVKRLKDVFMQFYANHSGQKYVVTYKDTLVKKSSYHKDLAFLNTAAYSGGGSSGQGGSMARFTLLNDHLYTVGHSDLSLFNTKTAANPTFVKSINLGWGVETIFPYENKLFIGTNTGMHIFNAADAANPVKLSTYSHVFACDPVVVQGKYAYVTLRTGTACRMGSNQLEVVDIEDPTKPKQVAVFPMKNPHGLSVSGNNLFLCEGDFGIKSFNITNKNKIGDNLLQHLKDIKSFDVIAGPKSLIVTGQDGVYQFNYSNASNLRQLSKIRIQRLPIEVWN
ncbi:MAG: hypothetical protein REI64_14980 [Pedobacter sp.]|uniref:LVIVD repeat-containing protein n=1 Tax=Pedobacter sp. TaxID=1411316 RepID=UPI00280721B2|nr:hypothetical protein [Pedobacter sp.]MDQ8006103.1 hypothetical protein [Pedobacter sp.]